jgi:uncharacterized membrane protein YdfJ with MMPL/SSD domain
MPTTVRRLFALSQVHHRFVLAFWFVIVLAAIPFAARQSDHLTANGFTVPGSQSSEVEKAMARGFPQIERTNLAAFIWPLAGATAGEMTGTIRRLQRAVRGIPGIMLSQHDLNFALFAAGLTGPLLVPFKIDANSGRAQDIAELLRTRLGLNRSLSGRVEVHLLGESGLTAGLQETIKRDLASAERVGLPILFVVLLAVFGSFSAATLPIVVGIVAVLITGALIFCLSLVTEMSVFVTNTASMLGIGLAVDYSLIILGRVRQELRDGSDLTVASKIALRTSGRAVVFSGITVMASLMGLWLVPIDALHSMALGAILVVALSVTVSVTLLPALIGVLGARRVSGLTFKEGMARRYPRRSIKRLITWDRWARAVTRHPAVSIAIAGGLLVILCIPVLGVRTNAGTLRQLSATSETRRGFTEAAKLGGAGSLGPVEIMIHATDPASKAQLGSLVSRMRGIARHLMNVRKVESTYISHDHQYALFSVVLTVDPESPAAERVVQQLRNVFAQTVTGPNVSVAVGGTSARQLDLEHKVATSMWKAIAVVMVLVLIVLMVLLRSVLLPFKAVVMSLLSVGAAYGVLVIVFQWGWLDPLFGYHSLGYLDTLTLPLIIAIVLGLSMDYEVFLLSRIKEKWIASGNSKVAVGDGLKASATTISSAAIVLVCVFAVFVGTGIPSVKELGLGVAVAIALDVTLIRFILVPAVMSLLGDWSWWMPSALDRVLLTRRISTPADDLQSMPPGYTSANTRVGYQTYE